MDGLSEKKAKRFAFLFGLLFIFILQPSSSSANYPNPYFSGQYSKEYKPLTNSGTYVPLDHWLALPLPIGFTFNLFGRDFDRIHLGNKGIISFAHPCDRACPQFGEVCDMPTFRCYRDGIGVGRLGSTSEPFSVLAAYWDDLDLLATLPSTEVRFRQEGTAPNRVFIAEWANMIHHQGPPSAPRSRANFQARLYEPNSIIELHYGPFVPADDKHVWSGQVGIQNHNNQKIFRPIECDGMNDGCPWQTLLELRDQVLIFGAFAGPELIGSLKTPTGARSAEEINVPITIHNIANHDTQSGFHTHVYLQETTSSTSNETLLGSLYLTGLRSRSTVTATLSVTMPVLSSTASYILKGHIDPAADLTEGAIQNNVFVATQPLATEDDVGVSFDNAMIKSGRNEIVLSYTINNRGPRIPDLDVKLYVSDDLFLDSSDSLLTQFSLDVAAIPSVTRELTLSIANVVANRRLILVLDSENQISETNESNNSAVYGPLLDQPELSLSVESSHSAEVGKRMDFEIDITSGGAFVEEASWEIYYSLDSTLDANDYLVASGRTAIGLNREVELLSSHLLSMMPSNDYRVISIIDPQNEHAETNETNNTHMDPHVTEVVGIDLRSFLVEPSSALYLGQTNSVTAEFSNVTSAASPPFSGQLLLSDNRTLSLSDTVLATVQVPGLQPSETVSMTIDWTATSTSLLGQSYLGVVADNDNQVIENNEINNAFVLPNEVEILNFAPDYTFGTVSPQTLGSHGDTFVVAREFINQGVETGLSDYAIYLAPNRSFEPASAQLVATGQLDLQPNTRTLGTDSFVLAPNVEAGFYYLTYVIDPQGRLVELNKANNSFTFSSPIEVRANLLTIESDQLPRGVIGRTYRAQLITMPRSGGNVRWAAESPLPPGLVLDPTSGEITGTPSQAGLFQLQLNATRGQQVATRVINLFISENSLPLSFVTPRLPLAQVGKKYSIQLIVQGGIAPYSWQTEEPLPQGLELTSEGLLHGTPKVAETINLTFTVIDTSDERISRPRSLKIIDDATAFQIAPKLPFDVKMNIAYSYRFEFENGTLPIKLNIISGSLPEGLALEDNNIRGRTNKLGAHTVLLEATDSGGQLTREPFTLRVVSAGDLNLEQDRLQFAFVNSEYVAENGNRIQLSVSETAEDLQFAVIDGLLPPGISLSNSGEFSGKTSVAGSYSFVIEVQDARARRGQEAFTILVVEAPAKQAPTDSCSCSSTKSNSGSGPLIFIFLLGILLRYRKQKSPGSEWNQG